MCAVAEEMQRMGKCIVIGLQSTGEARTLEAVEVNNILELLLHLCRVFVIITKSVKKP